jgi:hypothetical protein
MKSLKQLIVIAWVFLLTMLISMGHVTRDDKSESGKDLYKQDCRVCHDKGSPNGEYTPMSLTQDQWKAFFKNKFTTKHKDVILPQQNKKLLEMLTPLQIEKIQKFCVDHAADSEQPQTCSE